MYLFFLILGIIEAVARWLTIRSDLTIHAMRWLKVRGMKSSIVDETGEIGRKQGHWRALVCSSCSSLNECLAPNHWMRNFYLSVIARTLCFSFRILRVVPLHDLINVRCWKDAHRMWSTGNFLTKMHYNFFSSFPVLGPSSTFSVGHNIISYAVNAVRLPPFLY